MKLVEKWMGITFVCVIVYLVLSRSRGFSTAITAIGGVYNGSVRSLQGR